MKGMSYNNFYPQKKVHNCTFFLALKNVKKRREMDVDLGRLKKLSGNGLSILKGLKKCVGKLKNIVVEIQENEGKRS